MFFESFIFFIISFLFGASTLVIGARNPIHSILILILVFFLGSILLFLLSMEYFAILFLIVYVGAIVVLFLFIVMMLEIKMVNTSERFSDLFSFKNIILAFLVLEILFFSNEEFWDVTPVFQTTDTKFNWNITEVNLYTDYSKVLTYIGQLKAIGGILFSHYLIAIILISILLFISMFGSIVMTLESTKRIIIKQQDATLQGIRNSVRKAFVFGSGVVITPKPSNSIIGGISSFIGDHPIATGLITVALVGGFFFWATPIVTPYVAPFITQILGGGAAATGGLTGALTGRTQTPFIPGGFSKTVEIGTTALAPDTSSILTDAAAAVVTTVAGAVTRNVVARVVDACTQTEPSVRINTGTQTEVPVGVVNSPELVTRLTSAEEVNAQLTTELAEARARIAPLEEAAQLGNADRELMERGAEASKSKMLTLESLTQALIARSDGAKETITRLKQDLGDSISTCHDLGAHSRATIMHLFNLLTEKSEAKVSAHNAAIQSSLDTILGQIAAVIGRAKPPMPSAAREQLLDQTRGTARRAARYALESMDEMNTVSATPIVEIYNDWFRTSSRAIAHPAVGYLPEPEGAAEAMPIKAGVSTHPDTFGLGSIPSRPDLGIAQPSMGRYAESPGASLVFDTGALNNTGLSRFLSGSHYRDAGTRIPQEVHAHLHLALRAILRNVISIKELDASSLEKLSVADAEAMAMEEVVREVFMIIMHHFL